MFATSSDNLQHPSWMLQWKTKWAAKGKEWIRRYLLADLLATVTGLLGVYLSTWAGASLIAVAYIGSIAEAIGYYAPLFVQDYREQLAIGEQTGQRSGAIQRTVRNLVIEFGLAELVDSGLTRPAVMALCISWIPNLGIATYVGMSVADIFFYGLAISGYELRKRLVPNPSSPLDGQTVHTTEGVIYQPSSMRIDSTPVRTIKLENSPALAVATSITQQIKHGYSAAPDAPADSAAPASEVEAPPIDEVSASKKNAAQDAAAMDTASKDEAPTDAPKTEQNESQWNEATYRLDAPISPPVVGHLVRAMDDASLPLQLPLYWLPIEKGQSRQIRIGRHSKRNTVVINARRVSREHALILQKEEGLYLRDNGSTAGTYLNWRKLRTGEELLIRDGDLLCFGEVAYIYQSEKDRK